MKTLGNPSSLALVLSAKSVGRFMILSACLLAAATVEAGPVIIDFGTDPGKVSAPADAFDYPFGDVTSTRSFSADAYNVSGSFPATFNVAGVGVGGDFNNKSLIGDVPFPAVSLTEFLTLEGQSSTPTISLFAFRVILLAVGGATSEWEFVSSGQMPFGSSISSVQATTDLANPVASSSGGFLFGASTLDQIQIFVQNSDTPASFAYSIDNISITAVPEASTLACLGIALVVVAGFRLRRVRQS